MKRKTTSTAKFYLFDVGVWNFLRGTTVLDQGCDLFGKPFEHWIAMELRGLRAFHEEAPELPRILVSLDEVDRITEDGIRLLHWRSFVERLWSDRFHDRIPRI